MGSTAVTPTPCPRRLTGGISEETLGRALVATPRALGQLLQTTEKQQQQQKKLNRQEGDNARRQKPNSEDCVNRQEGDNASRQKPNCEEVVNRQVGDNASRQKPNCEDASGKHEAASELPSRARAVGLLGDEPFPMKKIGKTVGR